MSDRNLSMSEARCFLLAMGGALLFGLTCLAAAIGPVNANCTCFVSGGSPDRPTLL